MLRRGDELEKRWSAWLVERNRRGTRVVLAIVCILYPAFALIDRLQASAQALPVLLAIRGVVLAMTIAMFALLKSKTFPNRFLALSSAYIVLVAAGIIPKDTTSHNLRRT